MKKNCLVLFLILISVFCSAKEHVTVIAVVDKDDFTGTQAVDFIAIAKNGVSLANNTYSSYISVSYGNNKTDSGYEVIVEFSAVADRKYTEIEIYKDGKHNGISLSLTADIVPETASYIADGIFYCWSSYYNFFADKMESPPEYVEELSTVTVGQSVIHDISTLQQLSPYSIAMKKDGSFLVACSVVCVELNNFFKVIDQPGKSIYESGNYSYAFDVGVTPGGTIYFKPATGRDIYRIVEGLPQPQKWKAGTDLYGPFTVLPNGSVILINQSEKKNYLLDNKKRTELQLSMGNYSYISAITVGPEGNIWLYDSVERRVKIYTDKGEFIGGIMPLVNQYKIFLNPSSMAVYDDMSFLLSNNQELWGFRKDGTPLWRLTELPGHFTDKLPLTFNFNVDRDKGLIYLADIMGKRLIKFLDRSYCSKQHITNPFEEKIISLNKQYWEDDSDPEPLAAKALLYEEKGAFAMAKYLWEQVVEADPFHEQANEHLNTIEVAILKQSAKEMKERTLEVLKTMGPASAKNLYNQTLIIYEKILNISPGEPGVQESLDDLKLRYNEKEKTTDPARMSIKITKVSVRNIYPSLMHYYRNNPVGYVSIQNTLKKPVGDVTASIFMMRYMDLPTESAPVREVKPGESIKIDLFMELNQQIFDLEEDLPKQAKVQVSYTVDGAEYSVSKATGLIIYRRTALSWDDSGKLASFIMPNDDIVSNFSLKVAGHETLSKTYKLSKKFFRGMKLCDALGIYEINYVEDPDSPFSKALGKEEIVDTVRFPRKTLMVKSGDCDDSTALLGSLLESAGIQTAIMTSPGHVFLAFNSGEPMENLWQFKTGEFDAFSYGGTIWIPVETTILKKGFNTAWQKASELLKKYNSKKEIEFLPVEVLREKYPPLPLPSSNFTIIEPGVDVVESQYAASVTEVINTMYEKTLTELESSLKKAHDRNKVKIRNSIAALHARFGNTSEAKKIFLECIDEAAAFTPPYINLANIKVDENKTDEAIDILKKGLKTKPDSIYINLLLARCYYLKGSQKEVKQYLDRVREQSPELAERYSYLESDTGTRARAADEELPFIWADEEE
ncbi:MAG: tetratricopeptide repeat protein [Spirochaetales bacterium]|nr:tetratricopeptide repeat protein [Spirochaetales bacterium]